MKYFKQHHESCDQEWTVYGGYEDSDITPEGDIDTVVYCVECKDGTCSFELYEDYVDPEDITEITQDEYRHVVEQLQKVTTLQSQIDDILSPLIDK